MLVQKQSSRNLKNILIVGGVLILIICGYLVYQNFSSKGSGSSLATPTQRAKNVPKDFGQALFTDPRFFNLVAVPGTNLITQSSATPPPTSLPAPANVQLFNVATGNRILFTWKRPDGASDATIVRITLLQGDTSQNIATLPAIATSFLYTNAVNGAKTTYSLNYVKQQTIKQSAQLAAQANATAGDVRVSEATATGVTLQWTNPSSQDVQAVEVYRSDTVGALGQLIGRLDPTTQTYADAGGKAGLAFYTVVWVGSVVPGQTWEGSAIATDTTPPDQPNGVTATYNATEKVVVVTWQPSASSDVISYTIYRSSSALSLGQAFKTQNVEDLPPDMKTLSVNDPDAQPGQPTYYTVVAVDAAGNTSTTQQIGRVGHANPFTTL